MDQRPRIYERLVVLLVLITHAALLAWNGATFSPTMDEPAHLASGIDYWRTGNVRAYCVNPPLVRTTAAIPIVLMRDATDFPSADDYPATRRVEFRMGEALAKSLGRDVFHAMSLARWACLPFSLVGAAVCYLWSRQLYGVNAGYLALALWCLFPEILGHGALITPAVPAAAFGVCVAYAFARWLSRPSAPRALLTGVALGIALLAKATWVILPPMLVIVGVAEIVAHRKSAEGGRVARTGLGFAIILGVGGIVLNAGYRFDGTFQRLEDYDFVSGKLSGLEAAAVNRHESGNRFEGTWLGNLPVPLPKDYVRGIDLQRRDFETWPYVYVHGALHHEPPWYYYLYAAVVKLPLGFLVLMGLRSVARIRKGDFASQLLMASVPLTLIVVATCLPGLRAFRYLMPIWPFLFVWVSGLAASPSKRSHWAVGVPVAWLAVSSLWVYPASLSYFNEFAGGRSEGRWHLIDSQLDWGQDLRALGEWYETNPEARPLSVAYFGPVDPRAAGVEFQLPPRRPRNVSVSEVYEPPPGWYAVSAHLVHGGNGRAYNQHGERVGVSQDYTYFEGLEPQEMVGTSILVYHITGRQ